MREKAHHIVLLPGMDGGAELSGNFRALGSALFSTIVITYPNDQLLDYDALEAYVREALAKIESTYVILAESFSGPIAIRIAANPPQRLQGIVLVATFHSPPLSTWLASLISPVLFRLPIPRWAIRRYLLGTSADISACEQFAGVVRNVPPAALAARARSALRVNVRPLLSLLPIPVMVVNAKHDKLVPPFVAPEIPHAHSVTLDGPHLILHTQAAAVARHIDAFFCALTTR